MLSFENAPVPLSLFQEDGKMLSCVKSDFMHKVEEKLHCDKITNVELADAVIFDGPAIVQSLQPSSGTTQITFQNMAEQFMQHDIENSNTHGFPSQIHIIFDHYDPNSMKGQTREKRSGQKSAPIHHIYKSYGSIPRNWKVFLSRSENK